MKKLLLALFFSLSSLHSAVIVVDNNAVFLSCENTFFPHNTIQSAINASSSGDEIHICKGTYNESPSITKNNLTLKGVGTNIDDVLVEKRVNIAAKNITLRHFAVLSTSSIGVYSYQNNETDYFFYDLHIDAKSIGIYLKKGGKVFSNLRIKSSSSNGIDVKSTNNDLTFDKLTIDAGGYGVYTQAAVTGKKTFTNSSIKASYNGVYIYNGDTASFDSSEINSSNSRGIYIKSATSTSIPHTFNNLKINSKTQAIYVAKGGQSFTNLTLKSSSSDGIYVTNTTLNPSFSDMTIDARGYGVYIGTSDKASFASSEINSSNSRGIYIKSATSTSTPHTFNNLKINSKKQAIYVAKGGLSFTNLTLKSSSSNGIDVVSTTNDLTFDKLTIDAGSYGVYTQTAVTGKKTFTNSVIKASSRGVYIANGDTASFDSSEINSSNSRGIYIKSATSTSAPHTFNNLKISSKTQAIYVAKGGQSFTNLTLKSSSSNGIDVINTTLDPSFYNMTIDANMHGIYVEKSGKASFDTLEINSSTDRGIFINTQTSSTAEHTFNNLTINAYNQAIWVKKGGKSFTNLNLTSVSTGYNGRGIDVVNTTNSLTFDNININAGYYGIYTEYYASGKKDFKHLTIKAGHHGVYIRKGGKASFDLSEINSTNQKGIYIYESLAPSTPHTFDNLVINSHKEAIDLRKGGKSFTNLNLHTTSTSDGIGIDLTNTTNNLIFNNINIDAQDYGIHTYISVLGTKTFTNLTIKAVQHGIRIRTGGKASFSSSEINSSYAGIYIDDASSISTESTFDGLKIKSIKAAIYVGKGGKSFKNLTLTSTASMGIRIKNTSNDLTFEHINIESQKEGIKTYSTSSGAKTMTDINISNNTSDGIYIYKASSFTLHDYHIGGGSKGVNTYKNTNNISIDKGCIYDTSSYDLNIYSYANHPSGGQIHDNCLYGNHLAYAWKTGHDFTGNYWDGISGNVNNSNSKIAGYVTDNSPLTSCPRVCLPPAELVVDYRMDACKWDGTPSEVKDSSGNGYDATRVGSAIDTTRGKLCRAGDFKNMGTSDYLKSDIPIDKHNRKRITIMGWINVYNHTGHWLNVWRIQPNGSSNMGGRQPALFLHHSDNRKLHATNSTGSSTQETINTAVVLGYGDWHHVTQVVSKYSMKIYVDGTLEGTNNSSSAFIMNDGILKVGDEYYEKNYKIDEVKVFLGELSQADIQTIYNNENEGKNYDGTQRICECVVPVAEYRMDACWWDGSQGEVIDSSANHNDGTAEIDATTESNTSAGGGICHVGKFDGSNDVLIPNTNSASGGNNALNITGHSVVYMAWIKRKDMSDSNDHLQNIFTNQSSENALRMTTVVHWMGDNKVLFSLNIGGTTQYLHSSTPIADTNWHHVAALYDGQTMKIYIDGVKESNELNVSGAIVGSIGENMIGSEYDDYYFKGYIDELKVLDGAHSDAQILEIYNNELAKKNYDGTPRVCVDCSPLSNYRMDACEWTGIAGEVIDSSGNGHNGIAKNGADTQKSSLAGGGICRVGDLNPSGIDDYLDMGNINYSASNQISISVWIKPRYYTNWSTVITNSSDANWNDGFGIAHYQGSNNDIYFYVKKYNTYKVKTTAALNVWTHIVGTYDGTTLKIYKNGVLKQNTTGTNLNFNTNANTLIGDSVWSGSGVGSDVWKGKIDEVKVFPRALSASEILNIYNNESQSKNWDGTTRTCQTCGVVAYSFDAWETSGGLNDRNITTKTSSTGFPLVIAALDDNGSEYQNFTGTVCVEIRNSGEQNMSSWHNINFADENSSSTTSSGNPTFTVNRASKDNQVYIVWKKDANESCPLATSDGNTSSTDHFAIRPDRFAFGTLTRVSDGVTVNASELLSGEEYNQSVEAQTGSTAVADYNETLNFQGTSPTLDYNDTDKPACKNSSFSPTPVAFADGKSYFTFTYDGITATDSLEFNVSEINGSEFALIDADDTSEAGRLIGGTLADYGVSPYEANVTNVTFSRSTGTDWLYIIKDTNLSQMNIAVSATVDVYNKGGDVIKEFNSTCYASDVNLSVNYELNNATGVANGDITLRSEGARDDNGTLADLNKTLTIPKSTFVSEGEGNASYAFDINRSYDEPIAPLYIKLSDVNITSDTADQNHSASEVNASLPDDRNATFYYAQFDVNDISTNESSATHKYSVQVYDNQATPYTQGFDERTHFWFINNKHSTEGKVLDYNVTQLAHLGEAFDASVTLSSITSDPSAGVGTFDINNSSPKRRIIHLNIPSWLWYVPTGFGDAYSYDEGNTSSSCAMHPCFIYMLLPPPSQGVGVVAGDFNGSDFEVKESNFTRTGVKVFR